MLGEISRMRGVLLQAERKVDGLQKELDNVRLSIMANEARQNSLEKMSKELEAENAYLRAETQWLKIENSAQRQETQRAQVQV